MSKQKDKGTKRETWVVRLLRGYGLDATRAPNNLPSKDVELRFDGMVFAIEVKDRKQLNIHATMQGVANYWEDEIPAVVWHKTKKAEGAKRSVPDGPTIIALRLHDFARLLSGETHELDDEGEMS